MQIPIDQGLYWIIKEKLLYIWTQRESGRTYVGSAFDLSKRMYKYISIKCLEKNKTSYICNALKVYNYSAFSLSLLEIINITNLSKEDARKLILSREQYDLIY